MPTQVFPLLLNCPTGCGGPPGQQQCRFTIEVSWDEAEQDGWIYACNLDFHMLPEESPDDDFYWAEFGAVGGVEQGTGPLFEFTPKDGNPVQVTAANVYQQAPDGNQPGQPTGPGGCNVLFRQHFNADPVPDRSEGTPYRITYTVGMLEAFRFRLNHSCICMCRQDESIKTDTGLLVEFGFEKHEAPPPETPPPSSSSCFIASAVYGPTSVEVCELRRFRDETLLPTTAGRLAVWCYYQLSPTVAAVLSRTRLGCRLTRRLLDPVVAKVVARRRRDR